MRVRSSDLWCRSRALAGSTRLATNRLSNPRKSRTSTGHNQPCGGGYVVPCVVSFLPFTLPDRRRYGYRRHSGYDTSSGLAGGPFVGLLLLAVTGCSGTLLYEESMSIGRSRLDSTRCSPAKKPHFHRCHGESSGTTPVHDWQRQGLFEARKVSTEPCYLVVRRSLPRLRPATGIDPISNQQRASATIVVCSAG